MGWNNSRKFQKSQERRMQRYADVGRKFEQEEMRAHLQKMRDAGKIHGFEIFPPNSHEDSLGKDIMVSKLIGGKEVVKYFGVTISMHSWNRSKVWYKDTPQFCFPVNTKPETIERRILELFDEK